MAAHPPKPPLTLCIGVAGHRPNRLPADCRQAVAAEISRIFDRLAVECEAARLRHADFFAPAPSRIKVMTALAEGADRIVADVARQKGLPFDVLLPFPVETYRASFDEAGSGGEFHRLFAVADRTLVLPALKEGESSAFEALSAHLLSLCDLLLVIWDGGPSEGKGGTTETLMAAGRLGIPVIHIDANCKADTRLLWNEAGEFLSGVGDLTDLADVDFAATTSRLVENITGVPSNTHERAAIRAYYAARAVLINRRLEYPLLTSAFGTHMIAWKDIFPDVPSLLSYRCDKLLAPAAGGDSSSITAAFGWADAVGSRFAQIFRSAVVCNFFFAALAVVLAVASPVIPMASFWLAAAEFMLVLFVVANTILGRKFRWHQRWLEAREVTERLRVALLFWLIGLRPPILFSGREPTWIGWYTRAIIRWQGLRSGALDLPGLKNARLLILKLLQEQCQFHHKNADRMRALERRLERTGLTLFVSTIVVIIGYILAHVLHAHDVISFDPLDYKHAVVAMTGGIPALATAIYGIRMIGDFEGIAKRSGHTKAYLNKLIEVIEHDPLDLRRLSSRVRNAADIMLSDVETWRIAVESRPLAIPG
jgi:hypothetical protein